MSKKVNLSLEIVKKSFSLFGNQTVIKIDETPIEIHAGMDGCFFVAAKGPSSDYFIRCYSLGEECNPIKEFKTVTAIRHLYYLKLLDWVITLEKDTKKKSVARIYFGWRNDEQATIDRVINNEKITQINILRENNVRRGLDEFGNTRVSTYIELPVERPIRCAATCPSSPKFAVATKEKIIVWHCSPSSVQLLYEIILDVNLYKLDIYENYIGYSSPYEVRVLCIDIQKEEKNSFDLEGISLDPDSMKSISMAEPFSSIIDDQCIDCMFDAQGKPVNSNRLIDLPRLRKNIEHRVEDMEFEILGPLTEDVDHCIKNVLSGFVLVSSSVILHRQFQQDVNLHSMYFLPEFSPLIHHSSSDDNHDDDDDDDDDNDHQYDNNDGNEDGKVEGKGEENEKGKEMRERNLNSVTGLRFLISTTERGYLYDIRAPRLLAEYPFLDPTTSSIISNSFLYSLTKTGLEVWTLRSCLSAGEDFPPPCAICKHVFTSLQRIIVVGEYVILFSRCVPADMSLPNWSLYVLRNSNSAELYLEIQKVANDHKRSSPSLYFQLSLEAYFLLSAKLQLLQQRFYEIEIIHHYYSSFILSLSPSSQSQSKPSSQSLSQSLSQLYSHYLITQNERGKRDIAEMLNIEVDTRTCYKLLRRSNGYMGDYYFETQRYQRSAVFYSESDRKMSSVIIPMVEAAKSNPAGGARRALITYLDTILFDPSSTTLSIIDETPELSNEILRLYYTIVRNKLPSVILDSCLRQYDQELALKLLEDESELQSNILNSTIKSATEVRGGSSKEFDSIKHGSDPDYNAILKSALGNPSFTRPSNGKSTFVRSLLYMDLGKLSHAINDIHSLEPEVLVEFCVSHPQLLNPDPSPPSPSHPSNHSSANNNNNNNNNSSEVTIPTFGELLNEHDPWPLLEIVIRLRNVLPVNIALKLLQISKAMSSSADLSSDHVMILQCYIEDALMNGGAKEFPKLIPLLASLYLKHIIHDEGHYSIKQLGTTNPSRLPLKKKWIDHHINTFNRNRSEWLSSLPPFNEGVIHRITSPFINEQTPITIDYFYIQKLQGLLIYSSSLPSSIYSLISDQLLDLVKAKGYQYSGKLSIQLLTWPTCGYFDEAIKLLVQKAPHISRSYCKQFCKTPDHWRIFLTSLLHSTGDNNNDNDNDIDIDSGNIIIKDQLQSSPAACDRYAIYKEVLEELANTLDPETVLGLLPSTGNIHFFLPYIAKCFRSFQSKKIQETVILQTKSSAELNSH